MENKKFSYTYSAPTERERKEIENIKMRYGSPNSAESQKSVRLKKLDAHVKNTALSVSVTIGVLSVLIFGSGMALVMSFGHPILGTITGLFGILGIICAPLLHSYILNCQKRKYGEEIMALADEILAGEASENQKGEV